MGTPAERDAAVALHRQNINLRSVTRNDPAAVEILETSAYSTIYHYEDPEWEKQKMEGPTFIIRRDKSPQFAIYMLNRQTVKNVTIPLIPGEIKVTVVKEDMLQIARRGEKVKRAMWFSEGEDGVQRFRAKILEICGEPSRLSASTSTPISAPISGLPNSPSPPPSSGPNDGFSRLFAGLMPGASQSQESISGIPRSSTPTPAPSQKRNPPSAEVEDVFPEAPIRLEESRTAPQRDETPSTGQTADDLLMSILGMSPPPVAAATSPMSQPSAPPLSTHPPVSQQPSAPPASQILPKSPNMPAPPAPVPQHLQSPYPPHGLPAPPPPIPTESKPPAAQFTEQDFPTLGRAPSHPQQSGSPLSYSQMAHPRSPLQANIRHPSPFRNASPGPQQIYGTAPPPMPNGHPINDPMMGAVARTMTQQDLGGTANGMDDGMRLFVDTLLRRIHTEPGFVDALFDEFNRLHRGPN